MERVGIIHYGEIGLKGENRPMFERTLRENCTRALRTIPCKISRGVGRLVLSSFSKNNEDAIRGCLQKTFGIEHMAFGFHVEQTLHEMAQAAIEILESDATWKTFRIETKRANKHFPLTSTQIDKEIGSRCIDALPQASVKLKGADLVVNIEIINRDAFVLGNHLPGAGGLPTGSSASALALLSGGIDSPVAAWRLMKRGCRVDFVHFHNEPYTSPASTEKVLELASIASLWQGSRARLFLVSVSEIQKYLLTHAPRSHHILFLRRAMMRIAQWIASEQGYRALITGESVGQVASQTLENICITNEGIALPIFRPLIGMDKREIIETARSIGTYHTSILPHEDCCSLFAPSQPETKGKITEIFGMEKQLPEFAGLLEAAFQTKKEMTIQGTEVL